MTELAISTSDDTIIQIMYNVNTIPLSLYIHFPWCVKKCPYCDFNSHALRDDIDENAYITCLIQDLKEKLALMNTSTRPIFSIFMGGGTPSLFSEDAMKKILDEINNIIPLTKNCEITMEANPGTLESKRFKGYLDAGINRLSIGVQSFSDTQLKTLGRIHSSEEAKKAITTAKEAGFENLNIDLMFGLPKQTVEEACDDLHQAISLNPTHLSWYQLTLEPNTLFYHNPPALPENDALWAIQSQGQTLLDENGFKQYEISAYARNDKTCVHNMNYWTFGDYIGIGAGAHSKITTKNNITRYWNVKHPKTYMNPNEPVLRGKKTISEKELPLEFFMNTLRLNAPIPIELFEQRTGLKIQTIENKLREAAANNFITLENKTIQITPHGLQFLNEVLELFI